MFTANSSPGVKSAANRMLVLLFVVGVVGALGQLTVKAQGKRRRPAAGVTRASAARPACGQLKAAAEGRVKELRERVDNDLRELGSLQSRFAARTLSYDDWVKLSDVEKKKAIEAAEGAAVDFGLDHLKKTLVKIGNIGPIDAADLIKKYQITDPGLIDFLKKFALDNVYQYPTWAQKVEKAIDFLKAYYDVKRIAAGRAQGDAGWLGEYMGVIFGVLPYAVERYAFSRPSYRQAEVLRYVEVLSKASKVLSLLKSISASGVSIYASYIGLRNIATLNALNDQDSAALTKLNDVLKADVRRLKQARQELTDLGDCPDESELVFTYSVNGAVVPDMPGLNQDFVAALRDQQRLLNAAQATDDPTLKNLLLTAAGATNKNNVRVSADPAYYAALAAQAKDLDKKIEALEAKMRALSALGQVDAARALEPELEALILEKNKVMEKATPQPAGPPSYVPILGNERAGSPARKGISRVFVINRTGKGIAVSFGSRSVRLANGIGFTKQVPAGRYGLVASTTSAVGGRILRGESSLTVAEGIDYEVTVSLAKRDPTAAVDESGGSTPQVHARVVGGQPSGGSAFGDTEAGRGGAGPLYYTYNGGKLIPEGAAAPGDKPPPELLKPERGEDLREWLAKHPQFLNRVLSNDLPPELKSRPIELSDQEATDRSKIPPGWIECSCPSSHPGLGIFIREGRRIRQFHDPNFQCP